MKDCFSIPRTIKEAERIPPRGSDPLRQLLKPLLRANAMRQVVEKMKGTRENTITLLLLRELPHK